MPARPGLDRDIVVRAAAELYDASDGAGVRLKDVAARLGVKTPSLYNHIRGQDGLLRDLALYAVKQLEMCISKAAIGKSGDQAVLSAARAYREFAHQHPGIYPLTQRAPAPDDDVLQAASAEILEVLHLVLLEYDLSDVEEVHAIRALRSLVHGFVSLEISNGFGLPVNIDESFEALLVMYIRGLRREAPSHSAA
jgi:AcrR family transcriptional regulator